jgi:UDP-2-acetamido-2,6-beta-L-arabino-hexul-4-ose reductase
MKVKIDQLKTHSDMRGTVFEPIDKESIHTQENCHVVMSEPGVVRGNHYHLIGTETIAVSGPAFLRFKEGNDIYDVEVPVNQVYQFIIPPKVSHAIKNTSTSVNILMAFNTIVHDPLKPDVISDILINKHEA